MDGMVLDETPCGLGTRGEEWDFADYLYTSIAQTF